MIESGVAELARCGAGEARWHHDAGIFACGNAADLIDPCNGENLTAALASGRKATEAAFAATYETGPLRTAWRQLSRI